MDIENMSTDDYSGNETILIVDDELALRQMLYDVLSTRGYRLIQASSGEQALNFLKSNDIDLLISDVAMPEMDGYELADKVRGSYPDVKVQLVSGYSENVEEDRVLHKRVLYKPFRNVTLLKRVRNILDD